MGGFRGFRCAECGTTYPLGTSQFCPEDFGALEAEYDLTGVVDAAELYPVGRMSFWPTPMIEARHLGRELGLERVWIKDEGAAWPTGSFKDRAVQVALRAAQELGIKHIGCSSTGNLAASVAGLCARMGLESSVFVPGDVPAERLVVPALLGAKVYAVEGDYDAVNRLCNQLAFEEEWGFVNINLRHFYVEGCKSIGHEIVQQRGGLPRHVIAPVASGSLLRMIHKGLMEASVVGGWGPGLVSMHAAQATGCNPISGAIRAGEEGPRLVTRPETVARSIAVGDPGDGYAVMGLVRETKGWAEDASDGEILEAVELLGRTEGIVAEPAGGVVVAVARKLLAAGRIGRDEEVVLVNGASGMKSTGWLVQQERAVVRTAATREAFLRASGLAE